jgi:hypothetical protein
MIVEECFKWATQRKVFGKPLIQQPVIRQKCSSRNFLVGCDCRFLTNIPPYNTYRIAIMFAKIEAIQSWLEHVSGGGAAYAFLGSLMRRLYRSTDYLCERSAMDESCGAW